MLKEHGPTTAQIGRMAVQSMRLSQLQLENGACVHVLTPLLMIFLSVSERRVRSELSSHLATSFPSGIDWLA
jgi:hypothetical protein